MGRRSIPSDALPSVVREYFGIPQQELAHFLGLSPAQLANCEAGRRWLAGPARQRLDVLAARLSDPRPPRLGHAPPEVPAAELPAPAPGPLDARRDYCQHHARQLRRQLRPLSRRAIVAGRWQLALPALLTALPAPAPGAPDTPPPGADDATLHAWATVAYPRELLRRWAEPLSPEEAAQYHLLRLRAEALETEAAALAALLA